MKTITEQGVSWSVYEIDEDAFAGTMLGEMLEAEAVFFNTNTFQKHPEDEDFGALLICVACNDLFAWGVADAQEASLNDWNEIMRCWKEGAQMGLQCWCVKKRNVRPQQPFLDRTSFQLIWDDLYPDTPLPTERWDTAVKTPEEPSND